MRGDYYNSYRNEINRALEALVVSDASGQGMDAQQGFDLACSWAETVRSVDGLIYFCGNGASAAMASHMSLDWLKNSGVKAACFNDLASLTAFGNDTGFENVFAVPLKRLAASRDLLVTISSSGNSPNVLAALRQARESGMKSIAFSGLKSDNQSRGSADLSFYIPCRTYGIVECAHQILLHSWLDQYMGVEEWKS
jgi:D-sedoheptulose 7-phosphate isomerase